MAIEKYIVEIHSILKQHAIKTNQNTRDADRYIKDVTSNLIESSLSEGSLTEHDLEEAFKNELDSIRSSFPEEVKRKIA